MLEISQTISYADFAPLFGRFWDLSGNKILRISEEYDHSQGSPVFTCEGIYTSRGWTEWTQGFEYGSALIQFEATGDPIFLDLGQRHILAEMAPHLTHFGVHDHGFNTVSTYGTLRRVLLRNPSWANGGEVKLCETAIACSGAVQARRWMTTGDGLGYIYSFNGPHSLFADTIRSLRVLALAHHLGHVLLDEGDSRVSLLGRLIQHALTTAQYTVYYGEGRDIYDVPGRVAHESIFDTLNGRYRCPGTQQGYSPFSTWTRGLAWIILGFSELIEYLQDHLGEDDCKPYGGRETVLGKMDRALTVTADFYIHNTPTDGIPYWDTGAPGLERMGDYLNRPAEPHNSFEPVDSSAAAIAAQGFVRFGQIRARQGRENESRRYLNAGLTIARALFQRPYLSISDSHQGLLLHSVYHRPNGWDHVRKGLTVPADEAGMWGDYHLRELALLIQRLGRDEPYLTFWEI